MERIRSVTTVLAGAAIALFLLVSVAVSHTQFPPGEAINASKEDVKGIETLYAEMEKALAAEDLDKLMSFFADDYFHLGVNKSQLRSMWEAIFAQYDRLNSTHIFSRLNVERGQAVLVCTGALTGVPKDSAKSGYVTIDRWVNQNHWLSLWKKTGNWQIVGGASHWKQEVKVLPGGVVEHELEFHPLF